MNLAKVALENKVTTLVLTVATVVGGLIAYENLGRLEDPVFTIKDAVITTPYPGATPEEVVEEVADELEKAIQRMGQHKWVESRSERGQSVIKVKMKDNYDAETLPQVWDELRRKINDAQGLLPPGAGPSNVNDDFGDVFGLLVAIYGEGYSYRELEDFATFIQRELLLMPDVAKIEMSGLIRETIYVELDRDRMAQLGVDPQRVFTELASKNLVADTGSVEVGTDFVALRPTGEFTSEQQFGGLLISGGGDEQIYLRDVATIERGLVDPPGQIIHFDGYPAITIGVSTTPDGNVVTMGDAIQDRIEELRDTIPVGIEFGIIAMQNQAVTESINAFIQNLVEAVIIVVIVLLIFMGLRSGLLIGFILFMTICATFILMSFYQVTLERISLGALIIALGMLVDNAIVVVDGMLVRLQKGEDPEEAAIAIVDQQSMPLLGATAVAIIAFAAIGTSQDQTGEYCRSLFQVVFMALGMSWVTAVTVTPVLGVMFLRAPKVKEGEEVRDPYGGAFYSAYRAAVGTAIRFRWVTLLMVAGMFFAAVQGFENVGSSFFPAATRPQFMVDYYMPQGSNIRDTEADMSEVEQWIMDQPNVTHVATHIGAGALRFMLVYSPEYASPSYGQFIIEVDDFTQMGRLINDIEAHVGENYPHALANGYTFQIGPGEPGKIRARLMGPDRAVLRQLSEQVMAIYRADPNTKGIRTDWRDSVKVVRPIVANEQANLNGIKRRDISQAVRQGFQGVNVGVFRELDHLIPIVARAPDELRDNIDSINNLQIWSPAVQGMIPLRQVVSGFETTFEDDLIYRQDRRTTLTVFTDPIDGPAAELFPRVRQAVESGLVLPDGYTLEWWGEYKDSVQSQEALAASIPIFLAMMVITVLALFNNIRQTLVIWLAVPLALIGVTAGLLMTEQPFSFMAILGFLSLIGMMIKNAIVLVDETKAQLEDQDVPFDAIVMAGTTRVRPVSMAAATTILGMIPLFQDVFFVSMAVTIAFGLGFATILTMVVVPVLYATIFRVKNPPRGGSSSDDEPEALPAAVPDEPVSDDAGE